MHDILMITYNRPIYTKLALERLLASCDETMRVWVWQNSRDEETISVVKALQEHPRFHHYEFSPENRRLREPTNWFWENVGDDCEYLSKVDDDCMLPDGWGASIRKMLQNNPRLGIVGCWRFYEEDFLQEIAQKKIIDLANGNQLMKNCWVQGSGYILRRDCQQELGGLRTKESFPGYCIRAALSGWQNGWAYPFIHEEHMDDPRSPYCLIKTDAAFMKQRPLSAIHDNVTTIAQWGARVKYNAKQVQRAHPDPKYHVGWRKKIRILKKRAKKLIGVNEEWRR